MKPDWETLSTLALTARQLIKMSQHFCGSLQAFQQPSNVLMSLLPLQKPCKANQYDCSHLTVQKWGVLRLITSPGVIEKACGCGWIWTGDLPAHALWYDSSQIPLVKCFTPTPYLGSDDNVPLGSVTVTSHCSCAHIPTTPPPQWCLEPKQTILLFFHLHNLFFKSWFIFNPLLPASLILSQVQGWDSHRFDAFFFGRPAEHTLFVVWLHANRFALLDFIYIFSFMRWT